jgi:hypothetical protein
MDITPVSVPSLSLSATYFDILSYDRIQNVAFTEHLLNNTAYGELIIRELTAGQRASACKTGTFVGTDQDCLMAPIGAIADGGTAT